MSNFHAENIASILNKFDSNMDQGLSAEAFQKAKARHGKNEVSPEESRVSFCSISEIVAHVACDCFGGRHRYS